MLVPNQDWLDATLLASPFAVEAFAKAHVKPHDVDFFPEMFGIPPLSITLRISGVRNRGYS